MKVLTYNIAGNRARGRQAHLEAVAELIKTQHVDVVGLQEVIHYRSHRESPDEILARLTGMHVTFVAAHQFKTYCLGNAVLCREPISETITHELPHSWPERRVLLEVHTTAAGLPLAVFCTHLVHMARMASRLRLAQVTAVAKRMQTCFRPHLLVGDLNTSPHSRELEPVREICPPHEHMQGLCSWPARRPWLLYDHIWPGPGWVVEKAEILDLHVSDHRPFLAKLGWKGAPRYNITPDEPYLQAAGQWTG